METPTPEDYKLRIAAFTANKNRNAGNLADDYPVALLPVSHWLDRLLPL